jgi:hypothetical protein
MLTLAAISHLLRHEVVDFQEVSEDGLPPLPVSTHPGSDGAYAARRRTADPLIKDFAQFIRMR